MVLSDVPILVGPALRRSCKYQAYLDDPPAAQLGMSRVACGDWANTTTPRYPRSRWSGVVGHRQEGQLAGLGATRSPACQTPATS